MRISRRNFLKTGTLAFAGTALLSKELLAESSAKPLLGIQLYSIRDDMKKDPAGTLKQLAAMGYKNVEHAGYGNRKFYGYTAAEFKKLLDGLGLDVPVIVKTATEMAAIEAENPLLDVAVDPSRLIVAFAAAAGDLAALASLDALVEAPEKLHVGRHAAFLWCANGILESKAGAALLGKVGRAATTRNWATVLKIQALMTKPGAANS